MRSSTVQKHEGQISNFYFLISPFRERLQIILVMSITSFVPRCGHFYYPDTLVPGGPEIDFGVFTGDILLFGEAKWKSSVGAAGYP